MAAVVRPRTTAVQPTSGEEALLAFLQDELDENWTIYVQPFLNGDEPDFVALNPDVGVIVFEVKDYAEGAYTSDQDGWMVHDRRGSHRIASPIRQIERYRRNIVGLYCPEIGEQIDRHRGTLAVVRLVLYFHRMKGETARKLCRGHSSYTILGFDDLKSGAISARMPEVRSGESVLMRPEWANSLEAWLNPPRHLEEHGRVALTPEQRRHAMPVDGRRRLRGVAGSGKSLVLAHRAAARAARGERILVLTYNITLANYVRDLMRRARNFPHDVAIVTHFHEFCKLVLDKMDRPWPQGPDEQYVLNYEVPNAVQRAIASGVPESFKFDGIYIDEAQDFQRNWFELCTQFLRSDTSEVFLVADHAQNVYARDLDWTGDMSGLNFRGPWAHLDQSHRLPSRIRRVAWDFAKANGLGEQRHLQPPEGQRELFVPDLVWHDDPDLSRACRTVLQLYSYLHVQRRVHPQDISILLPTHALGAQVVEYLRGRGENPNHVFDGVGGGDRRNKRTFWMGSRGVKMCTVHSFKGWETRFVIALLTDAGFAGQGAESLLYVVLTRALQGIFVVNSSRRVRPGDAWDSLPPLDNAAYADFELHEPIPGNGDGPGGAINPFDQYPF